MAGATLSIEVDQDADASYIRLNPGDVARSVEVTECVVVDLSAEDTVLGIEVLGIDTPISYRELERRFGMAPDLVALIRRARTTAAAPA